MFGCVGSESSDTNKLCAQKTVLDIQDFGGGKDLNVELGKMESSLQLQRSDRDKKLGAMDNDEKLLSEKGKLMRSDKFKGVVEKHRREMIKCHTFELAITDLEKMERVFE